MKQKDEHNSTKQHTTNIFAKAQLKEVIEHLYYYQLLCIFQLTVFKCRAIANTRTLPASLVDDRANIDREK